MPGAGLFDDYPVTITPVSELHDMKSTGAAHDLAGLADLHGRDQVRKQAGGFRQAAPAQITTLECIAAVGKPVGLLRKIGALLNPVSDLFDFFTRCTDLLAAGAIR